VSYHYILFSHPKELSDFLSDKAFRASRSGILGFYKLASSVNLYRFTHFLDFPFGAIFANLLVGAASPIPFDRYLRYRLLVHSERFPEKEKTWTAIWHPG